ncbi:hypothetical protein ACHAXS_012290 [Conticribra weissflogii]
MTNLPITTLLQRRAPSVSSNAHCFRNSSINQNTPSRTASLRASIRQRPVVSLQLPPYSQQIVSICHGHRSPIRPSPLQTVLPAISPALSHPAKITTLKSTSFSTNSSEDTAKIQKQLQLQPQHKPPLPIRIALVSTTTALATPSFPALGFLYLVLRITVPDAQLRKAMEGSWGTLFSFCTWTLLPKLYSGSVASLVLPCAIANGLVAGSVYGLVDVACGGVRSGSGGVGGTSGGLKWKDIGSLASGNIAVDGLGQRVLATPWVSGAGIGATVGYVAPNHVYGPVMEYVYGMEGMAQSIQYVLNVPFATEVCVVTGAVAGTLLHPLLFFPMNGIQGVHWGYYSGAALALVTSALYYVYYGQEGAGLPVPVGSFIDPSNMDAVTSILRYNNETGEVDSYSLYSGKFLGSSEACLEGRMLAESSRAYARSGNTVFDDRLLAFVYNFWDGNAVLRYPDHVVQLKPKTEIQIIQDSMSVTDAAVAILLTRRSTSRKHERDVSSHESYGKTHDLKSVLKKIEEMNKNRIDGKKQSPVNMDALDTVCVAIDLLMALKNNASTNPNNQHEEEIPKLEKFIRSWYPQIVLHKSDERYQGESVESQLQAAGWKRPEISEAFLEWKEVHRQEVYRTWRNGFFVVAAGAILSFATSFLIINR